MGENNQEQKNTPIWVIVLIIIGCSLIGMGGWLIGKKYINKETKEPEKETPPLEVKTQTLTCISNIESNTSTMNLYYEDDNLTGIDATITYDFSTLTKEELDSVKAQNYCDIEDTENEDMKLIKNCQESWSDNGILTMTYDVDVDQIKASYSQTDINHMKEALSGEDELTTCTIK